MPNPVRIVVAGAGLIGQAHIQRILAEPGARLAAIVDPSPHAAELASRLGVPYAADLANGLDATKPDGVVIATPNRFHVPNSLVATAAKIPMLVEKPIADDLTGAMQLVAAGEAAGVPILVGHHRRHSPLIRRAREIIASGRLGRITAVTGACLFLKPRDYFEGANAWRREAGGGVVLINLIHTIDDLRCLCGDIVGVQAMQSAASRGFPVEDTAAIILQFATGALGTVIISDSTSAPWSWEMTSGENKSYPHTDQFCYTVCGTGGSLAVPRLETWRHAGDGWLTPIEAQRQIVPERDPLALQMRHFCAVVRGDETPIIDGREAAKTLAATLAVKRAAETKTFVQL